MKQLNTFLKQLPSLIVAQKIKRYSHFFVDSIFTLEKAYKIGLFSESHFSMSIARNSEEKNVNCKISFGVEEIKGI